jgi:hypothetical protein
MQSFSYPPLAQEEVVMDFKQFVREFERYRDHHQEQSLQQALDGFVEEKQVVESEPQLVGV